MLGILPSQSQEEGKGFKGTVSGQGSAGKEAAAPGAQWSSSGLLKSRDFW